MIVDDSACMIVVKREREFQLSTVIVCHVPFDRALGADFCDTTSSLVPHLRQRLFCVSQPHNF